MKRLALVCAVLAALAANAHAEDRNAMPQQFRGTWCKTTDTEATDKRVMSFYPIKTGAKCDSATLTIDRQYHEGTWTCDVVDVNYRRAEFRYAIRLRCNADPTHAVLRMSFALEHGTLYVTNDDAGK